jgi:hypothetical protein
VVGAKIGRWLGFTCSDGACRKLMLRILNGGGLGGHADQGPFLGGVHYRFRPATPFALSEPFHLIFIDSAA